MEYIYKKEGIVYRDEGLVFKAVASPCVDTQIELSDICCITAIALQSEFINYSYYLDTHVLYIFTGDTKRTT